MPDRPATRFPLAHMLAALLLTLVASSAAAQRFSTAQEVMDAMSQTSAPATMTGTLTMTITAASGHTLAREMQLWVSDDGPRQLIRFTAPADVRGSGFLSLGTPDGGTESFVYLPALDRVRRVAGGQEQDAFFGSDFSYEDITGVMGDFDTDDYDLELLEIRDGPVYVVQATPPGPDASYERVVYEVPEDTLIPSRIEFYRSGALFKLMTLSGLIEQDGFTLPAHIRMETVATGSFTVIEQTGFELNTEIPDEVFTERYLSR